VKLENVSDGPVMIGADVHHPGAPFDAPEKGSHGYDDALSLFRRGLVDYHEPQPGPKDLERAERMLRAAEESDRLEAEREANAAADEANHEARKAEQARNYETQRAAERTAAAEARAAEPAPEVTIEPDPPAKEETPTP
jgi:hypothetical protein